MLEFNWTLPVVLVMFLVYAVALNLVFFAPVRRALAARAGHLASEAEAAKLALAAAAAMQDDYLARLKQAQTEAASVSNQTLAAAEAQRSSILEGVKAELAEQAAAGQAAIRQEADQARAALLGEVDGFAQMIATKAIAPAQVAAATGV